MHTATCTEQAHGQPVSPANHIFAIRLSWRLVGIVQGCLREEEMQLLAAEYYRAILQDLRDYEEKHARR